MKREVRVVLQKATDALVLSMEHFNRRENRGRISHPAHIAAVHTLLPGKLRSDFARRIPAWRVTGIRGPAPFAGASVRCPRLS